MDKMKQTCIYSALAALLLALVAFMFFFPDDIEGNVLQQHDILQGIANGQEGKAYHEATGETTRWTNALFGGMPNFQIAPSYPANSMLSWIGKVYTLGLPSPANLLFGMMLGFFIMCLCLGMKWYTSLFASLAWGFSSYFIIIIGAGHIWKFVTLSYIPPTIGGIALCYRGRYLPGLALTALFGALQLQSNHPQMTYYFLFVVLAMVLAWLWTAIRDHKTSRWVTATACVIVAGALGVAANSPSLYNSYEYSKETVRGRATDLTTEGGAQAAAGMDRNAITAWSYGLDETFSLIIPNVKGGATIKPQAGQTRMLTLAQTDKAADMRLSQQEMQFLDQFPQYFGDQPMTNGPVYVGAVVLLLAIMALFVVQTPMKWALFAVSILAILLSWGHNFSALTDLFIDYFPFYNKFRAVSSILVIVEFTIPLLAALCLIKILKTPDFFKTNRYVFYGVFGGGLLICLAGWMMPSVFGSAFSASEETQLAQMGVFSSPEYARIINAVRETRYSLVSADSLRSFFFILVGGLLIWLYIKGALKNKAVFVSALSVLVIIDLFSVNKRYVNSDNFTRPTPTEVTFNKTAADEAILRDTTNYRVMDISGFGEARSSYFHKTIGGYHAAKLTRYNDLITHQISKRNPMVLNMLNAKYLIDGEQYQLNPDALGNAWFVGSVKFVDNANEEMAELDSLNTAKQAVADKSFAKIIGTAKPKAPGDTIYETSYAPNRLSYKAVTKNGGVAVFSEIYFPWGWKATIDGKEAPIGRADYVLRALNIPAGSHDIVFEFNPKSVKVTNTISVTAVCLIYIVCLAAICYAVMAIRRGSVKTKEEKK